MNEDVFILLILIVLYIEITCQSVFSRIELSFFLAG